MPRCCPDCADGFDPDRDYSAENEPPTVDDMNAKLRAMPPAEAQAFYAFLDEARSMGDAGVDEELFLVWDAEYRN